MLCLPRFRYRPRLVSYILIMVLLSLGGVVAYFELYLKGKPGLNPALFEYDEDYDYKHNKPKVANGYSYVYPSSDDSAYLANATFLSFVRNRDLQGISSTIRSVESHFNSKFGYPWTFFTDETLSSEFKRKVKALVGPASQVYFVVVARTQLAAPKFINSELMKVSDTTSNSTQSSKVTASSPNIQRWHSGLLHLNAHLKQFKYFFRLDPRATILCDVDYDIFRFMQDNQKVYGFSLTSCDGSAEIPGKSERGHSSLWQEIMGSVGMEPQQIHENSALQWITDPFSSVCRFVTGFELGNLDYMRSLSPYNALFEVADRAGGFFYEQWSDRTFRTVAYSLLVNQSQIHLFEDIGAQFDGHANCPSNKDANCDGCPKTTTKCNKACSNLWFRYWAKAQA